MTAPIRIPRRGQAAVRDRRCPNCDANEQLSQDGKRTQHCHATRGMAIWQQAQPDAATHESKSSDGKARASGVRTATRDVQAKGGSRAPCTAHQTGAHTGLATLEPKHKTTQTTERTTTIASRDSRRGGERTRRLGQHALLNDGSGAVGSCHEDIPHHEGRDATKQGTRNAGTRDEPGSCDVWRDMREAVRAARRERWHCAQAR